MAYKNNDSIFRFMIVYNRLQTESADGVKIGPLEEKDLAKRLP
jgi:hypothetical protein